MRTSTVGLPAGFTLIEVLMALVILTVGLLALARGMTGLHAHARRAMLRLQATSAAAGALERLSVGDCTPRSGSDSAGPVRTSWSLAGTGPAATVSVRAEAPGIAPAVVVTLESARGCRAGP